MDKNEKLSYLEFIRKMISLRAEKEYKGIIPTMAQYTVPGTKEKYSFNQVMKGYYGETCNPVEVTQKLAEEKLIQIIPFRGGWSKSLKRQMGGGVTIRLAEDATTGRASLSLTNAMSILK
jgi:hypothetical protein